MFARETWAPSWHLMMSSTTCWHPLLPHTVIEPAPLVTDVIKHPGLLQELPDKTLCLDILHKKWRQCEFVPHTLIGPSCNTRSQRHNTMSEFLDHFDGWIKNIVSKTAPIEARHENLSIISISLKLSVVTSLLLLFSTSVSFVLGIFNSESQINEVSIKGVSQSLSKWVDRVSIWLGKVRWGNRAPKTRFFNFDSHFLDKEWLKS